MRRHKIDPLGRRIVLAIAAGRIAIGLLAVAARDDGRSLRRAALAGAAVDA